MYKYQTLAFSTRIRMRPTMKCISHSASQHWHTGLKYVLCTKLTLYTNQFYVLLPILRSFT